ncbi:uncharacterized protein LOC131247465 [Magnolia sinica]|uniref:uncharacterized protein LOC131247465 n=1 Tax=Magnolia sinica TaxID=86752 RepID=UPI00265946E5|nr:uncharacterized protein LOC131247465 [Magnolia sinica]
MGSPLPLRFRMSQITPYYGAGDSAKHIESFKAWRELHSASSSDPEVADKRDKQKYYHFHYDHGLTTTNCFDHKEEIKSLIQGGHLREYVHKRRDEQPDKRDDQQGNTNDNEAIGEILTIFGGPARGGDSNRARKAHAWSISGSNIKHRIHLIIKARTEYKSIPCSLTFTEEDTQGIHHPHDNALVVIMTVINHKVHHILVDTGSSADILFAAAAFDKMEIGRSRLRPI